MYKLSTVGQTLLVELLLGRYTVTSCQFHFLFVYTANMVVKTPCMPSSRRGLRVVAGEIETFPAKSWFVRMALLGKVDHWYLEFVVIARECDGVRRDEAV